MIITTANVNFLIRRKRGAQLNPHSRCFPKVRTGWPDHDHTTHFDKEIRFYQEFCWKTISYGILFRICLTEQLIVLIRSEIRIGTGMVWLVSSDKWKAPSVKVWVHYEVKVSILTKPVVIPRLRCCCPLNQTLLQRMQSISINLWPVCLICCLFRPEKINKLFFIST